MQCRQIICQSLTVRIAVVPSYCTLVVFGFSSTFFITSFSELTSSVFWYWSIHWFNHSNFYSTNLPGEAKLTGAIDINHGHHLFLLGLWSIPYHYQKIPQISTVERFYSELLQVKRKVMALSVCLSLTVRAFFKSSCIALWLYNNNSIGIDSGCHSYKSESLFDYFFQIPVLCSYQNILCCHAYFKHWKMAVIYRISECDKSVFISS